MTPSPTPLRQAHWKLALWLTLAGWAAHALQPGRVLDRLSYDLTALADHREPVDDVVVVFMDDLSHARLHQPYDAPWSRALHARLVDRLFELGARAVVFDVLFNGASADPSADEAFGQANRRHRSVVLGADLGSSDYYGLASEISLIPPMEGLLGFAEGWGFVQLAMDSDESVRRHAHGPAGIPSLSWRAAQLVGGDHTTTLGSQDTPRWINHRGPPGVLPQLSYFQVLEDSNAALGDRVRNRVVLVGSGNQSGFSGKRRDQFRTPFSMLGHRLATGVEIHATLLSNLLHRDWHRRLGVFEEWGVLMLLGLGIPLAASRSSIRSRGRQVLCWALLIPLVAYAVVVGTHHWFPWVIPTAVQLPLAWWMWPRSAGFADAPSHADPQLTQEYQPRAESREVQVPDHVLLRLIGSGSYGEVWLARNHLGLHRAVKVVHRRGAASDRRLDREWEGVVRFEPLSRQHPGLVPILHVGRNDTAGYFYCVMELADDSSRHGTVDVLQYRPWSLAHQMKATSRAETPGEVQELGVKLCRALTFLHDHGLVHRDIKPSNILIINGQPRLADVGLVTEIDEASTLVGTPGYFPPEGPGTVRADVYAVAMVLYEFASGCSWKRFPEFPADRMESGAWRELQRVLAEAVLGDPGSRCNTAASLADRLTSDRQAH